MGQIKFEQQLKEKLEKRQLQPSEDAWARLERGLENDQPKATSKKYWWLAVAAGFVGVLLMVTFFNKTDGPLPESTIVDSDEETIEKSIQKEPQVQQPPVQIVLQESVTPEESPQKLSTPPTNMVSNSKQGDDIAQTESKMPDTKEEINDSTIKALSFEDQKAIEVAMQIKAMQQNKDSLNEVEIDALLAEAQKEIELNQLYDAATNSVNAEALLESVEDDLDKSFREKVFEALKSSYTTVKTAVAERNN